MKTTRIKRNVTRSAGNTSTAGRRLQKTMADYVAIALTPLLIMILVGSLVFFLLEISYSGQFETRLKWILFWFVLGSVLVSRISIEQGSEHAAVFGAVLALATGVVILRLVDFAIPALCLLGVVWWCVKKLTWDCSFIDDNEDASGEGLLQVAGFDDSAEFDSRDNSTSTEAGETNDVVDKDVPDAASPDDEAQQPEDRAASDNRPHAPGLWVVYFSLAALPMFGIGQLLIPSGDADGRDYGFRLLWVYVAAGLGLLLTTSFLGLRRYLRQRRLRMPAAVTGLWIGLGAGLIVTILLLCILLPRPNASYSITALVDRMADKAQKASRIAFLNDDAGQGKGQRTGKAGADEEDGHQERRDEKDGAQRDGDRQQQDGGGKNGNARPDANGKSKRKGDSGRPTDREEGSDGANAKGGGESDRNGKSQGGEDSKSTAQGESEDKGKSKDNQSDEAKGNGKGDRNDERQANNKQEPPNRNKPAAEGERQNEQAGEKTQRENPDQNAEAPQNGDAAESTTRTSFDWVGSAVKWIIYALLGIVILYFVFRHWATIVETLARWFRELKDFLSGLFGKKKENDAEDQPQQAEPVSGPPPSFASFDNPFQSGLAGRQSPAELIVYTFQALEAWGREQGCERPAHQTPIEYSRHVSRLESLVSADVRQVAELYARLAYAGLAPSENCRPVLERLWQGMTSSAQQNVSRPPAAV